MARSLGNRLMNFLWGPVEDQYDEFYEEPGSDLPELEPEPTMPDPIPLSQRRSGLFSRREENNVVELQPTRPAVAIQHPRSYDDAQKLGAILKRRTMLIIELTHTDEKDRGKLICFLSGLVYGLDGTAEEVSELTYAFMPRHFDCSAEPSRERLTEPGFVPRYRLPD